MFKGFVLSESLNNPLILNGFNQIKVIVENHPEYSGEPKIWHDFKIAVEDKDIKEACRQLSGEVKEGWYIHFWSDHTLYAVLPGKVFEMSREDGNWRSEEYLAFKKCAMEHGVEVKYLKNFLIED